MPTTYTPLLELPKHDPADWFDITKINEGFDKIDAAMAKAYRGKAVRHLLDNSDFRAGRIVNQRGATANTRSNEYLHDRWKSEAGNNAAGVVQITDAGVTLAPTSSNYCGIAQMLELYSELEGKTVTLAVCVGGVWDVVSFTLGSTPAGGAVMSNGLRIYSASGYHVLIRNPAGNGAVTIQRVALYEGAYTADTLPEYQPKGYAMELAECQRYYVRFQAASDAQFIPGGDNGNNLYATLHVPVAMRLASPTLSYDKINIYPYIVGAAYDITSLEIVGTAATGNFVTLRAAHGNNSMTAGALGCIRILKGGYIALSADL